MTDKKYDIDEIIGGMNGFDEDAVTAYFRAPLEVLGESMRAMRAVAFVIYRSEGKSDPEAYKAAMEMPLKDVTNMFESTPEDAAAEMQAAIEGKE